MILYIEQRDYSTVINNIYLLSTLKPFLAFIKSLKDI